MSILFYEFAKLILRYQWTDGITEEDGELVIEVPDGEDTAGE